MFQCRSCSYCYCTHMSLEGDGPNPLFKFSWPWEQNNGMEEQGVGVPKVSCTFALPEHTG